MESHKIITITRNVINIMEKFYENLIELKNKIELL